MTHKIKSAALSLLSDIRADLNEVGDVGWEGGRYVGQLSRPIITFPSCGKIGECVYVIE